MTSWFRVVPARSMARKSSRVAMYPLYETLSGTSMGAPAQRFRNRSDEVLRRRDRSACSATWW